MSDLPLVPGEVIGWRAWRVIGEQRLPLLQSVSHRGTLWHPAHWTLATCSGRDHCGRAPDLRIAGEGCSCGLYAARDRRQLVDLGYNVSRDREHPVFIGEVALAGKVIPGDQGWRAEKGRIKRLYVPFVDWRYVEPLAELYGVPVLLDNTANAEPTLGEGSTSWI